MENFKLFLMAIGFGAGLALGATAAFAQTSPGGDIQAPKLQPQGGGETPLPPAVPGADDQNLQTSQNVAKQQSGDPTVELFTAINANNYGAAQDAISRGADLKAQNALGESPIDLSVALNHNSITFMLLAARNDSGDGSVDDSASAAAPAPGASTTGFTKPRAVLAKLIENPSAKPGNDPGTPNPGAGFLGFNH